MAVQDQHGESAAPPPAAAVRNTVTTPVVAHVVQAHTIGSVEFHDHPAPPAPPVPRQLPPAPHGFVGRVDHLAALDRRSADAPTDTEVVVISAIGGAGGIGKTWLALDWAHRGLHRFPDGQLFADLRGFSPTGHPAHPVDVLGGFLEALGVDRDRQPVDPDRRAALYRSLVADKRMLVVLDNAATTDQVTPLLPGGRCTVLVTSRDHLSGLVARHGARPVHLDVLTDAEAHTLLANALGPDRADDERAVAELVRSCGGFPLAVGLIAARVAGNPHLPLADTVAELRRFGLAALDSEDPAASLPAVLSWSLLRLTERQRQVFALVGIAPGPDTGLPAAAALTGLAEREAHAVLRALADASLLDRTRGGRYAMHDLVRAYATTVADGLPTGTREAALRRVIDFYTHTAHTGDLVLNPRRETPRLDPPTPAAHLHPLPDRAAAWAWFDAEHACLLAAQRAATAHALDPVVWWLAWALDTFHYRRGHRHDRVAAWRAAAACHLPDLTIHTHGFLGHAHTDLGDHEEAVDHLHQALALAEQRQDLARQALTHHTLARARGYQGDERRALHHARRALDLYRRVGQPANEAESLNAVGWYAALLGEYDTARDNCQAALALHRRHHDKAGQATTLDSLGYVEHHSGHHAEAVDRYRDALVLSRDLGHAFWRAHALDGLGHPHAALGQVDQARAVWREALELYREQGRDGDADRVRRQLQGLDDAQDDSGG